MRDNCVVFANKDRQEVRVVFDPDGTAFFCGSDLAAIAGYAAPRKVVTGGNQGVNKIDSVLRKIPWDNGMKRGRCDHTCFSAENAVKLLCKRPAPYDVIRWFEDEVIPKAEEMGEEIARGFIKWTGEPKKELRAQEREKIPPATKTPLEAVVERLDAIILECALLKKEICQTR